MIIFRSPFYDALPDDAISAGPQIPENLVLGTTESNAQMLIIETAAKKLAKKGANIAITGKPEFESNREKYCLADTVKYSLLDSAADRKATIIFNMLSRRKIFEQEIPIIIQEITNFFTNGLQFKQKACMPVMSSSSSTIGLSQALSFGGSNLMAPAQNTAAPKSLMELKQEKKKILFSIDAIGTTSLTNKAKHKLLLNLYDIDREIEQILLPSSNTLLTSIVTQTPLTKLKEEKKKILLSIDAIGTTSPTNEAKHKLLLRLYDIDIEIEQISAIVQPNIGTLQSFVPTKKTVLVQK